MAVLLTAPAYTLLLADGADEVAAAQRLRYRVFADELGATLHTRVPGMDVDDFDDYCDHLIVRDDATGEVVGTYRMLTPPAAARAGRRYSDGEFDLAALAPLRDRLVETGRSCVHPDHRSGAVINLIWTGIARYLHLRGYRWLGGCASVPLDAAPAVWEQVRAKHLGPPAMRVRPRRPWAASFGSAAGSVSGPASAGLAPGPASAGLAPVPASAGLAPVPASAGVAPVPALAGVAPVPASAGLAPGPALAGRAAMPPLLRGYLRLGAWVCGEPAYDPDFRVADLFMLLSLDRMHPRYRRHFLGAVR